jgi:hypothetical protein
MFKILTLQPGVDAQLQAIQNEWQIDAVEHLGSDSELNHYLLVQYDTAPPGTVNPAPPSSGSVPNSGSVAPSPPVAKSKAAK